MTQLYVFVPSSHLVGFDFVITSAAQYVFQLCKLPFAFSRSSEVD